MKLSTFTHGILDYVTAVLLLVAPNLFGFADGGAADAAARVAGFVVLLQALMTDYECGVVGMIAMRTHLMSDYVLGLVLIASPWLFDFSRMPASYWIPHLLVGLFVLGAASMTEGVPRHGVDRMGSGQAAR